MTPEDIDLAAMTRTLQKSVRAPWASYIVGKSALRDAVAETLRCSLAEAEQVVDTLEARGFVRFDTRVPQWVFAENPRSVQ
jgi:hypothetical protein